MEVFEKELEAGRGQSADAAVSAPARTRWPRRCAPLWTLIKQVTYERTCTDGSNDELPLRPPSCRLLPLHLHNNLKQTHS
jgi:hypothetical protein